MGQVAARQWGRVSAAQLRSLGVKKGAITRWLKQGYLHRLHPRVYAVGHTSSSSEADLAAALLYAGPGAMLSHATAAWWLELSDRQPTTIHVSTPRRCRSLHGLKVHPRRECERVWHNGLTVTSVAQTLLDCAASASRSRLRRALAEADYRGLLDIASIDAACGPGRPGTAAIRDALERHLPQLAVTRSVLEERFLALCESAGFPIPEVNATVEGLMVDALWRGQGVVVELDGHAAHSSKAQVERDHQRDLRLRAAGFVVLRYTWRQITETPDQVAADIRAALSRALAIGSSDLLGGRSPDALPGRSPAGLPGRVA